MSENRGLEEAISAANEWWGDDDVLLDPEYPIGEKGIFVKGWMACRQKFIQEIHQQEEPSGN